MTTLTVPPGTPVAEAEPDPRTPRSRLGRLLDEGWMSIEDAGEIGVATAAGTVGGVKVVAYCTDPTRMGGALSRAGGTRIAAAVDRALSDGCPVIGVWHSGGARLADGVSSMDGVGQMFAAMIRASGRVPQISVVLGPAAGAAAYGPALTDLTIMARSGRMFITGPDVVHKVTGERVDMETLGGADAHGRSSGVVHVVTADEAEAFARTTRLVTLLGRTGDGRPEDLEPRDLAALLPAAPQRAYDVRPLVRQLLDRPQDPDGFVELQPRWARNITIGLGRLDGRSVGVIANNPLYKGGCLDSLSAEKAARFVRMCNAFGTPLIVVVDVPGYLPGVREEWDGVIRRGAKLLHAFGEAVVPRVTLITRKSYGGAYIAMNSRALGATAVLAWPSAEVAVMGAEAAVEVLHRKKLAAAGEPDRAALLASLIAEQRRAEGGVRRGLELGVIDEVIDPADTRRKVGEALAAARAGRGRHGNIPL